MTIAGEEELERLKEIGRIVANTLAAMGAAIEPGMTTAELDDIGRRLLELEGAQSAPELCYGFPGAGYLDKVAEITDKSKLAPADVVLLKSLDLAKLALYEQAKDLSVDLMQDWLAKYKFKNWNEHRTTNPGKPVEPAEKVARAKEIATELANHKTWHSHGRNLDVGKLKVLRLEIDDYSDDAELLGAIRSYNDPLTGYTDRLSMPFLLHHHSSKLS